MGARLLSAILALGLATPLQAFAASFEEQRLERPFFDYHIVKHPERVRGLWWRPIVSVLVPGLDQWIEGQYRSAIVYSGYAAFGLGVAFSAIDMTDPDNNKFGDQLDGRSRRYAWGNQAYMDMGFVSAYHSFRKSAETKKPDGKFLFLKHEETAGDLMLAPLHFEHLLKPSIFIPLGVLGALVAVTGDSNHKPVWRGDDLAWAGAMSVNAGVGEEAMFRGYIMPMAREGWGSDFWSNTFTAAVFATAHVSGANPLPWPQFLLGWYLGWRVQKEEWRLSQSIFLHTWWDVLAIGASFAQDRGKQQVYLPLVHASF